MTGDLNYVSDEPKPAGVSVDSSSCDDLKLPPYPQALRKRDKECDPPIFDGNLKDFPHRIRYKLLLTWFFYAKLRYNTKLEEILAKPTEDRTSTEYILKCTIVDILDEVAKILTNTNLLEELKYLYK